MNYKKVKLIYFSLGDSSSREVELTWSKFVSLLGVVSIALFFLVSTSLYFFTNFYQNLEISSLSKVNDHLRVQLAQMGDKLSYVGERVDDLEAEDDHLRIIADLPKIDEDTRDVGVGGVLNVNYEIPLVSEDISTEVFEYQEVLGKMLRRLELTKHSRKEIKDRLEQNKTIMKHTPSIRPLLGGRINDKFGFRRHPLLEKVIHHKGVDISAERGTEVFATAAGVVEKVITTYQVNKGYGKYVLIDHGYGLKTLYGHMSKVFVSQGQKIVRWKPVGLVGSTGLATGPHLHYEVRKEGKQIDPLSYILN